MEKADLGLIGLAVMGQNLVLNMDDHGFKVVVFNRTVSRVDDFLNGSAKGTRVVGAHSLEELVARLGRPRRIMLMVKAGRPVDELIERLVQLLEEGDIIVDGGNSDYRDTMRRARAVEAQGLLYIGTGVSGGEEGARLGPSIMPGGSPESWKHLKTIFQAVAAKMQDGTPCCEWVGEDGAGHFVKMVHNGIEYGDMQPICESYHLMKEGLGLTHDQMHEIFANWSNGKLDSYLIEITRDILGFRDADGTPLVEKILDSAGQKGTGKWAAISAVEMGVPLTLIGEAVLARFLSTFKEERVAASRMLRGPEPLYGGDRVAFLEDLEQALYVSKIVSYAQGYMLMRAAASEHDWNLNYGGIALMWRGGCIIRSVLLEKIEEAFDRDPSLSNLLLDPHFKDQIEASQAAWRRVVSAAVKMGVPIPAMSSALVFYDGYRHGRLPANLLQAQRDYFGAHSYERVDHPRGEFFHTDWTGHGGKATSGTYLA